MLLELRTTLSGSILDLGGGGDGVIGRLYGPQVVAIDNCQEELEEAPEGFEKQLMDAADLQFPDGSFDHVTAFYALMYMRAEEQAAALQEAYRVLTPGGSLQIWDCEIVSAYPEAFCTELDLLLPCERFHTAYGICKLDTQDAGSIQALCAKAGFTAAALVNCGGHFHLTCVK